MFGNVSYECLLAAFGGVKLELRARIPALAEKVLLRYAGSGVCFSEMASDGDLGVGIRHSLPHINPLSEEQHLRGHGVTFELRVLRALLWSCVLCVLDLHMRLQPSEACAFKDACTITRLPQGPLV